MGLAASRLRLLVAAVGLFFAAAPFRLVARVLVPFSRELLLNAFLLNGGLLVVGIVITGAGLAARNAGRTA